MKFIHLGDLHLGKSLGDFDLIEDQRFILDQILTLIDSKSVDAVMIAGDVYDKSIPSEAATRLLDYFLNALASREVKTYIISGNHDSDERLNYGSSLFRGRGIYISAKFNGQLERCTIKDKNTEADIYLMPFVKASQVKHFFPEENIENYEDAFRVILKHTELDETKTNILVAHQFVAGRGADPALGGSECAGTQSVGLVERIGYDLFDAFDYVALGHIHAPQKIGREEVRYSGSPLKYSLSEVNNDKSVPVLTVDEKGVQIELVALKPKRDLRHIKGKMEVLLRGENVKEPEDFMYVTLTDEDVVNDAMGIFQQVYPNTVKIDYDNSRTREVDQVDISKIAENRSFTDLIRDFYRQMYQCEISGEEMEIMRKTAGEAGIIDETD
jgi:exonuclease SbcD